MGRQQTNLSINCHFSFRIYHNLASPSRKLQTPEEVSEMEQKIQVIIQLWKMLKNWCHHQCLRWKCIPAISEAKFWNHWMKIFLIWTENDRILQSLWINYEIFNKKLCELLWFADFLLNFFFPILHFFFSGGFVRPSIPTLLQFNFIHTYLMVILLQIHKLSIKINFLFQILYSILLLCTILHRNYCLKCS